jgi:hypothetical protein
MATAPEWAQPLSHAAEATEDKIVFSASDQIARRSGTRLKNKGRMA